MDGFGLVVCSEVGLLWFLKVPPTQVEFNLLVLECYQSAENEADGKLDR